MTKYLMIDFQKGFQVHFVKNSQAYFHFDGLSYTLSQDQVAHLIEKGVLLVADISTANPYACHRCRRYFRSFKRPTACPLCDSETWDTYTLLYCCKCHALFEYYWHLLAGGNPYDRFPKCPACGSEHWCAAEEERLKSLPLKEETQAQAQAKRQAEKQAYTSYMEFRKQQQMKKLGLSSASRAQPTGTGNSSVQPEKTEQEVQKKGAAITEAEAFYQSKEDKSNWLNKKEPPQRGVLSDLRGWFKNRRS